MTRARSIFLLLSILFLTLPAGAQVCAPKPITGPGEVCQPTPENPDPCPSSPDIRIEFSCRIEDCIIHVFASEARKPMLEKVLWKLSDGYSAYGRGPEPRVRRIFPFPGIGGTTVWAEATPYWKDTGVGKTIRQEYAMDGDVPYFGYNTNFWGSTVEFGTSFGNPYDWSYHWTYGDGTVGQNAGWIATCKTYDLPGRYLVSLRMDQGNNCAPSGCESFTVERYVDVPNTPPLSTFTYSNDGKRLTVDAGATRDEPPVEESYHPGINYNCGKRHVNMPLEYEWDWGDGTFGSGLTATHDYAASGMYKVVLLVRDRIGATHSTTKSVSIPEDPPKPAFSFNCHGGVCDFDAGASAIPNATAYVWTINQVITGGTVPQGSVTTTTPTMTRTFGNGIFRITLQVQTGQTLSPGVSRELRSSLKAAEGLVFVTLPPCRLIDTRETNTVVSSGQALTIPIWGGIGNRCVIPSGVSAIAVNLSTDIRGNPGGRGWLHAFRPGWGEANQTVVQYFNPSFANGIRANNTIVEVANDQIRLVPVMPGGGTIRLIADATGYFVKSSHPMAAEGLRFKTSPYCITFESAAVNQPLITGTNRYVALGKCLSAGAKAASLIFTALNPTSEGHVKITPTNFTSDYIFSSINMWAGLTLRNGWLTPIGGAYNGYPGDFRLSMGPVEGASTHYQMALNGWFQADGPLVYYPIDPCRTVNTTRPLDTGYKRAAANVSQHYQVRGNCGVPKGAVAAVINVTAFNPSGAGDIALFPSDAGRYPGNPQQASIYQNYFAGDDMTTGAIVSLSPQHELDLGLKLRSSDADIFVDVVGYFGPPGLTNAAEAPDAEQ